LVPGAVVDSHALPAGQGAADLGFPAMRTQRSPAAIA
jgi:hypothetical protein